MLGRELTALGAEDVRIKDFAPGRPNVWGRLAATGGGPRLLLTGHTDTVHVRGWAERWAGTERADPFGGAVVDGEIWGRGAGDLKAGICTTLAAARLVREAGLRLPRELLFAFVGDEESGEPGSGVSAGMKALVAEIEAGAVPRPDIAIYVEPTRLNVYPAQMGFLICDIEDLRQVRLFRRARAWRRCAEGRPRRAGRALGAFGRARSARRRIRLVGRPFLLVTDVTGRRLYRRARRMPDQPDPQVDPRPEPRRRRGRRLRRRCARRRSRPKSASPSPIPPDATIALGGTPTETPETAPFVQLLVRGRAQRAAGSRRHRRRALLVGGAVPCRRGSAFPTVYCAPGDIRNCHTLEERVEVQGIFRRDRRLRGVSRGARRGDELRRVIPPLDQRRNAMRMRTRSLAAAALCSALALGAAAFAGETVGPDGEKATPAAELKLSDAEAAKVAAGKPTAALLWHTSSDFVNAVTAGAKDEFARLGVSVVAQTDAGFDAAKQKSDVETILAKKPSAILALPLDPVTSAEAFKPAVASGVKIVLLSNKPKGFVQGKDYVTIVTDDLFQMGKHAADALADAIGKKGKVAWIYHDAQYYVTNQRDNAFKTTIETDYPDIKIVAKRRHRRSRARRRHRPRAAGQEPRSRRHLRDLGGAGRRRARGAARGRQREDQDRDARPFRAGRARHGQGRQCRGDRRRQGL